MLLSNHFVSEMVILISRLCHSLNKLSSNMENHHHHRGRRDCNGQFEALSEFLEAFLSDVSKLLNQLCSGLRTGSEFLSLTWVQKCLELLPKVNRAFAKLVVEIDYPMIKWEASSSVEGYLNYTLNLMALLNSISYSLSHLRQARLCASHALTLLGGSPKEAEDRLGRIQFRHFHKQLEVEEFKETQQIDSSSLYGKEQVIQEALKIMKGIGYWVCGIVLSSLSGDNEPYLEMRKSAGGLDLPAMAALDAIAGEAVAEEKALANEMREANSPLGQILAAVAGGEAGVEAAEELQRKLEVMESLLDSVGKETDGLFSDILSGRNKLLECLRMRSQ